MTLIGAPVAGFLAVRAGRSTWAKPLMATSPPLATTASITSVIPFSAVPTLRRLHAGVGGRQAPIVPYGSSMPAARRPVASGICGGTDRGLVGWMTGSRRKRPASSVASGEVPTLALAEASPTAVEHATYPGLGYSDDVSMTHRGPRRMGRRLPSIVRQLLHRASGSEGNVGTNRKLPGVSREQASVSVSNQPEVRCCWMMR